MTDNTLPKAIVYSWPTSVWSTVARLCLHEKGYSPDEYITKQVDISKGENFAPSYLRININGTVPTLVVPTVESVSSEVDTRFRSLRDTVTICDFLDQARGAHTAHTVSSRPAPALSPATIEGKATSDKIVSMVHLPSVDPSFLNMTARDSAELNYKATSVQSEMLGDRRQNLQKYLAEARRVAKDGGSFESKIVIFLEEKAAANEVLWEVYNGKAEPEREKAFFEASSKAWAEAVPGTFAQLETEVKGPYVLGDQICLADLHLIAWVCRCVTISGGLPDGAGIDILDAALGSHKVGPKIKAFWGQWVQRESFQKECLTSAMAFREKYAVWRPQGVVRTS